MSADDKQQNASNRLKRAFDSITDKPKVLFADIEKAANELVDKALDEVAQNLGYTKIQTDDSVRPPTSKNPHAQKRASITNRRVVYRLLNDKTKRVYIGQTNDFNARLIEHKENALVKNMKSKLYDDIRKYGWEHFTKEVLRSSLNSKQADIAEEHYIKEYRKHNRCYNIQAGGKKGRIWR